MTYDERTKLIHATRDAYVEAATVDPEQTAEVVRVVVGADSFRWPKLSSEQIAALRRWCDMVRLAAA